ncbi:virB8 family protein [Phenylobacterium aquaticum]|uniref:virB8 family protein n=1 Tax=Phenylobacterium aquaticum TaxID=1763816 RepID=UPI001F5CDE41|nr:VirB8/TrbF family protein [Phenylobacterium aquaticum]MCI3135349.1 VirB8/TrbF family protein [Phenylobacterium aquaticum]
MSLGRDPAVAAYLKEARGWEADRLQAARRSVRIAWTLAAVASGLAIAGVAAVAALVPLHRVEPFVVRVDRTTGAVDIMTALAGPQPQTYDEAVSKYFLGLYVRAREGWAPEAAEANFRQVSILSAPSEQQRWGDAFRPSNPQSPQTLWADHARAWVDIRAVSFPAPHLASVRFHRTVRDASAASESDWIATIAFDYVQAPMAEADRLRNPLGFQVTSYRADPEIVP